MIDVQDFDSGLRLQDLIGQLGFFIDTSDLKKHIESENVPQE